MINHPLIEDIILGIPDFWEVVKEVDLSLEDPRFYPKIYSALCKTHKPGANEEYEELSRQLDVSLLQESCSVRNLLKTRALASALINEEGELNTAFLQSTIEDLKAHLYPLGPNRQHDTKRQEHILAVLLHLQNDYKLAKQLRMISKPHMHKIADQVIRDTLQLPSKTSVTDVDTRRAVLAAWLCYLRQNVGSCFATAPAILVHREQPELFLRDMQELLSTGQLKRTFGGIEYAVPLSYTWGAGDLRRGFVFSKSGYVEDTPIWRSPSLIAALEAVGVIQNDRSFSEKQKMCKELISSILKKRDGEREYFFESVEMLLRQLILDHLELTEKDIEEYQLRPQGMMVGSALLRLPTESKGGGKGQRCQAFLQHFEEAKNVFKGFSDNALLKTWEFTLASFAETKAQFTRWNLYSSLGMAADDQGGIGPRLFEILQRKLTECNAKAQQYQEEYEVLYQQLQFLQRRSRNIDSERDAQWVRLEYQTKSSEFYTLEALRDEWNGKARRYSHLYDGVIDLYYRLFPKYFQEIYDADIHEVVPGPFDDSPAGFRLLYKYGRSNTSQWTLIHNHIEFIDALANFFTATENELAHSPELHGLENDLGEIVTSIVSHVRSNVFLESAFHRMARAHNAPLIKNPLEHLDKIQKKPWVYTSGGSINTLVSCYFRLEEKPQEVSRWVENPIELLVFLIDSIKKIPEKVAEDFTNDPEKSLLIHSPTHAFLLKPGYGMFKEGWKNPHFTYTWARDQVVRPMEKFVNEIFLDEDRMRFVIDDLVEKIPHENRRYFKETFYGLGGSMQVVDFRNHIVDAIELTPGLSQGKRGCIAPEEIDATLFSLLPLFPSYKLKERVQLIVEKLPGITADMKKSMFEIVEEFSGKLGGPKTVSAKGLQDAIKALIALLSPALFTQYDYHRLVCRAAQEEGFAMPCPFIFADTNWVKEYFAFLVNPGTGKLELWRTDYLGSEGAPMKDWEKWLNGSRKEPDWGVFNRPHEYRF